MMETPPGVFERCCERFGWLESEVVESLVHEATDRDISPLQIAIEDGLLDATKADIIRTLSGQTEPIPGYEIEDVLGMGGMGVVYRARQVNLNRPVALKTVLKSCLQHADAIERFEQEAMVLGRLQHPHIISAIDFGKQANRIYFVMELVTGDDLGKLLALTCEHFDEWATWELVKQTAKGLAYAAQHGIVHRDIKPANLILVRETTQASRFPYHVKIADFGLARLAEKAPDDGLTQDGAIVGSPRYMAPEQLESSNVTPKADVYSLGVTAHHMLSGVRPFERLSLMEMIQHKAKAGPTPLNMLRGGLTTETYTLLDELLQLDPTQRPSADMVVQKVEKLQRRLEGIAPLELSSTDLSMDETILGAKPDLVEASQTPEQGSSLERRSRSWIGWAIGAVLLIAASLSWWQQSGEPKHTTPVRQQLLPSGRTLPLFNGQQLGGWKPLAGNWLVPPTEPVISGTDGVLQHVFLRRGPNDKPYPVENYRLELIFECREAAEIHFLLAVKPDGQSGIDVQVADEIVSVGRMNPIPIDRTKPHALTIERQSGGWFLEIDGTPFGAWSIQSDELPEVRIQVVGGPAWFSDIYLTELQQKPSAQ